jgi:hypothetical protein
MGGYPVLGLQAAAIAVTIAVGPLNYPGAGPEISCRSLPRPSR